MAANKTIGGINVTISATIDKFQKNMSAARRTIGTFGKSIKGLVFNLKTLGAALAVGGFSLMIKQQADAVDGISKLSDKLGVSTEMLAGFQLAAGETDISVQELDKALTKLSVKTGLRADEALLSLIDKSAKLTSQQDRLALATEYFGERGAKMVRVLNLGRDGLKEAQQAAVALGLAFDRASGLGVERAIDSFGRLKMAVQGVFRTIAIDLAPYIEMLSVKTTAFLASNGQGKGIGTFIADVIIEMSKNVVSLIQEMVTVGMQAFLGLQAMVVQFRTSMVGKGMGLGYGTGKESLDAIMGLGASSQWIEAFKSQDWAANIQKWVDEARKQSSEAAAKSATADAVGKVMGWADMAKGMLGGMNRKENIPYNELINSSNNLADFTASGMPLRDFEKWLEENGRATTRDKFDPFYKLGELMSNGPGQVQGLLGGLATQAMGMISGPGNQMQQQGRTPALAFAESGSVESYRQQAAIRKQGDDIAKKQLGVQQQIRDGIKDLAGVINFPAANLG